MKKIAYILPLIILLLFTFCGRKNIVEETPIPRMSLEDTLAFMMEEAISIDSLELLSDTLPITYLKTGYFLDSLTKTALLIQNPSDTSFSVNQYTQKENQWIKTDSISNLWGFSPQFDVKYTDYNFDGINDIFIQTSVSNGLAISRGHLLLVEPFTMKLIYQEETKELGNMTPDKENNVVYSQEAIIDNYGEWKYQNYTHEWIEGKLTVIRKDNPWDSNTKE